MKLTAPMAMPTPKTIPATTMATSGSPVAIVPVKAVLRTLTALSHGSLPVDYA